MSTVDRIGDFRGKGIEFAVAETKNAGLPQFVVKCQALEMYNEEAEIWEDWSEYGQEIMAYLLLQSGAGKNDPLDLAQVMKVFNWDGKSYLQLDTGAHDDVKFQFRVTENTYEGKTSLQVSWIDEYDAEPGRKVKKMTEADLKALDKKFGKVVAATKKAKSPPKAPAKTATTPTKKPVPPAKKTETGCTKDEAWDYLVSNPELFAKGVTEDTIAESFVDIMDEIAGSAIEEDKITPSQWLDIRDAVAKKHFVF